MPDVISKSPWSPGVALKHLEPLGPLPLKPLEPLSLAIILAAAISFAMVSSSTLTTRKHAVQFH